MIRFVALLCALLACLCAAPSFAGGVVVRQRIVQPRVIRQRVVVAPQALLVAPQRQTLILQQPAVQQLVVPQPSQQLLIIR